MVVFCVLYLFIFDKTFKFRLKMEEYKISVTNPFPCYDFFKCKIIMTGDYDDLCCVVMEMLDSIELKHINLESKIHPL